MADPRKTDEEAAIHIEPEKRPSPSHLSSSDDGSKGFHESADAPTSPTTTAKADDLDWRWYTFYGVLITAGLVALTLLIKGFIDAGDTEVRFMDFSLVWRRLAYLVGYNG